MTSLAPLRRATRAAVTLQGKAVADPIAAIDWTRPQHTFLYCEDRFKLLRTGNQVGKTTVGLAECVLIALGRHPHQRFVPPCEIWILCDSHSQSIPIQEKLWELLPRGELHEKQRAWNPVTGFGHHEPLVHFKNGSLIRFKTVNQGGIGAAGGTVHHILLDEPPTPRVLQECISRLRATGGGMSLTLTPINRDCSTIREKTEDGTIRDLHFGLTEENMRQLRSGQLRRTEAGDVCDAAWIEAERKRCLAHEVPIVIDGEWETRAVDRLFFAFVGTPGVPGTHVAEVPDGLDLIVLIGIDHGERIGNQAALLVGVQWAGAEGYPRVWVLEESVSESKTTSWQDADELIRMLHHRGWTWDQVDQAHGDIPTSGRGDAGRKGNRDLEDALRRRLQLRSRDELRPRIYTAKRGKGGGAGAPDIGERWLHRQMLRPGNFHVSPRCPRLIECLENYDGHPKSKHKHLIDALRYALRKVILQGSNRRRRGPRLRIP